MPYKHPKNQDSLINNGADSNDDFQDFDLANLYPEVTIFETINPMHDIKNNVNNAASKKLN